MPLYSIYFKVRVLGRTLYDETIDEINLYYTLSAVIRPGLLYFSIQMNRLTSLLSAAKKPCFYKGRAMHTYHPEFVSTVMNHMQVQYRTDFLQKSAEAARGKQLINFLKTHDPGYPNFPGSSATSEFRDFREFLEAYTSLIQQCFAGTRDIADPAWGLHPNDGLLSAEEIVEHCISEMQEVVSNLESQARLILQQGFNHLKTTEQWNQLLSANPNLQPK